MVGLSECSTRHSRGTFPENFSPTVLSIQLNVSMDHAILGMNSLHNEELFSVRLLWTEHFQYLWHWSYPSHSPENALDSDPVWLLRDASHGVLNVQLVVSEFVSVPSGVFNPIRCRNSAQYYCLYFSPPQPQIKFCFVEGPTKRCNDEVTLLDAYFWNKFSPIRRRLSWPDKRKVA